MLMTIKTTAKTAIQPPYLAAVFIDFMLKQKNIYKPIDKLRAICYNIIVAYDNIV